MTREEFEKYLGKTVEIKLLSDNETIRGVLRKTRDEKFKNSPNLYVPKNYYFITDKESKTCISGIFRKSHVKSIRESKDK